LIILDLCGGTGSWSRPYVEAGYDVRVIDLPQDVRLLRFPGRVHGILAAPPCTYFCRMRMCRGVPTDDQFREGLSVVDACLRIIAMCRPNWWALENPQGYLKRWLGEPAWKFNPCDYGDPWTKRTWLWGNFTPPLGVPTHAEHSLVLAHRNGKQHGLAHNARERSRTPQNFAQAFYEANP
jgi:hypothetical protein